MPRNVAVLVGSLRRESFSRKMAHALADLAPDTLMNPSSIAEAYLRLHQQTRDAWTFELDLRPFGERW